MSGRMLAAASTLAGSGRLAPFAAAAAALGGGGRGGDLGPRRDGGRRVWSRSVCGRVLAGLADGVLTWGAQVVVVVVVVLLLLARLVLVREKFLTAPRSDRALARSLVLSLGLGLACSLQLAGGCAVRADRLAGGRGRERERHD